MKKIVLMMSAVVFLTVSSFAQQDSTMNGNSKSKKEKKAKSSNNANMQNGSNDTNHSDKKTKKSNKDKNSGTMDTSANMGR